MHVCVQINQARVCTFGSDMSSHAMKRNHAAMYHVFVIAFTQSVEARCVYWIAALIPGCDILIFPSILYIQPTISPANQV